MYLIQVPVWTPIKVIVVCIFVILTKWELLKFVKIGFHKVTSSLFSQITIIYFIKSRLHIISVYNWLKSHLTKYLMPLFPNKLLPIIKQLLLKFKFWSKDMNDYGHFTNPLGSTLLCSILNAWFTKWKILYFRNVFSQ